MAIEKKVEKNLGELWDGADRSLLRDECSSKYVVARRRNGALELLHATLPSGGEALPVFATEQAAWRHLWSEALETEGWYPRESGDGELVSLLMSLCRGAKYVLLDPKPKDSVSPDSAALVDKNGYIAICLSAGRLAVGAGLAGGGCGR